MSNPVPCRLLIDPPCGGAWNMALDEALLEAADGAAVPCLRFYRWSCPTLSLGYFQRYADRQQHAPSRDCPAVRRLTGGGAILHDQELTYSLVVPCDHPLNPHRDRLYRLVHAALVEALAEFSLTAALCTPRPAERETTAPFLCFQRRSPGDVLLGADKIAGSAQRRRRGAVLQHGSLLVRRSPAAPELPGVEDLAGRPLGVDQLADAWLTALARGLQFQWAPGELSAAENQAATQWVVSRYDNRAWNQQR